MCTWVQIHRSQRCRIPLELELQVVVSHLVWVLGIKLRSRGRAVHAPNFGAVSLASYLFAGRANKETNTSKSFA